MRSAAILAASAALALAACAGAEATTLPQPAIAAASPRPAAAPEVGMVGLIPGETMSFEVRVAGLVAGEAQLAVGDLGDYQGHRAVVVKSHGETAGAAAMLKHASDDATAVIDFDTGLPLTVETVADDGKSHTTATATFTRNITDITYHRSEEPQPHHIRISSPQLAVHDAHSAMALLRGWRAQPGATRSVFVVGGRRLWRIDLKLAGSESIGSRLGNRRATAYSGAAFRLGKNLEPETEKPSRTFTVWLSDDADRVPLKVVAATELGDLVLELTDYAR